MSAQIYAGADNVFHSSRLEGCVNIAVETCPCPVRGFDFQTLCQGFDIAVTCLRAEKSFQAITYSSFGIKTVTLPKVFQRLGACGRPT